VRSGKKFGQGKMKSSLSLVTWGIAPKEIMSLRTIKYFVTHSGERRIILKKFSFCQLRKGLHNWDV